MKKSYIYGIITVIIWSSLASVAKSILNDIPNFQVLLLSSSFAFLFLLVFNVLNGTLVEIKKYKPKDFITISALGFVGLFMYSALYYYGLSVMSSQDACILNYLWPIAIVLFSCIILKEKISLKIILAILMSFGGIIVLTVGNRSHLDNNYFFGAIACIFAAACYGLFSVLNKKSNYNQSITMMIAWFTTALFSFVTSVFTEKWVDLNGNQLLGILYLGIMIDAIAYLLWALALKYAENSAKVANLAYLTPFLSVMISAVFLKEQVRRSAVIALLLIVGGIVLQTISVTRTNKRKRNSDKQGISQS